MKTTKFNLLLLLTLFVVASACNKDDKNEPNPSTSGTTTERILHFDGTDDHVLIPDPFGPTDTFTVEFKFLSHLSTPCGSLNHKRMFSTSNNFEIAECGGDLRVYTGTAWYTIASGVRDSMWHHLAVIKHSGTLQVFLDGTQTYAIGLPSSYHFPSIAIGGNGGPESFEGYMDDVRLWDKTLDSTTISNGINGIVNENSNGLVGYYKFDDNGGNTTIKDATPNTNHGTRTGTSGANTSGPLTVNGEAAFIVIN